MIRHKCSIFLDFVFVFQMTNDLGSGERGREMKNSDTDDDTDIGVRFAEEVRVIVVLKFLLFLSASADSCCKQIAQDSRT